MKKFLPNRALAAKEIFTFFVLLFAALVLKGTCAYAQGISTDNYAWRLDGIRLKTVVHESEDGSYLGTQVDDVITSTLRTV